MKKSILLMMFASTVFFSCKKDKTDVPEPENEEEVITDIILTFTSQSDENEKIIVTANDPDGEGIQPIEIKENIVLKENTVYNVTVEISNKSDSSNPIDITEEVKEEGDEHLFCYTITDADVSVKRTDSDGKYEIGIESTWTTKEASEGKIRMVLKHQPDIKDGTCEVGDADIDLTYTLKVEAEEAVKDEGKGDAVVVISK